MYDNIYIYFVVVSTVKLCLINCMAKWSDSIIVGTTLTFESQVVTITCNTSFDIPKCHVLPTQCIEVFHIISEQAMTFPLYNIKLSVFITNMECVYCAVRNESLNIILVKFSLHRFND